jgi:hypothetical protein
MLTRDIMHAIEQNEALLVKPRRARTPHRCSRGLRRD